MRRLPILAALLALAVAGCGSSDKSSSSASSGGGRDIQIALVTGDNHDPFYVTMNKGAQAAAKKLGVSVSWQGPATFEAQPQISILNTLLSSKPSALLVAPTDVKALISPLNQFKQAGVPVITVDTDVNDKSVRLGNFTSDNQLGGKIAADFLAKSLPAGAQVVYVGGPRGVFTTDQRLLGYERALKSTDLEYLGAQVGQDDDVNTATTLVGNLLQRNPNLVGIFASDTAYGAGAATAVQNAGKAGKVKIVAFDAEPDEVQALRRGLISALIVQKAYTMGYDAVTKAVAYLRHKTPVPAETHPSYVVATKANVDSPTVQKYIYSQH